MGYQKERLSADDAALDQYGVWVHKAVSADSEGISEVPMVDSVKNAIFSDESLSDYEDEAAGGIPETIIQTEREAGQMSDIENKKDLPEDDSEAIEISLDDADEIDLSEGDDLSDLSDLLLSIDEETADEETVYLEDEDLSLDIDTSADDFLFETEDNGGLEMDDFDEEIIIPGLDDELSIESLDDLSEPTIDDSELEIPNLDDEEIPETALEETEIEDIVIDNIDELEAPSISISPEEEEEILNISLDDENDLQLESSLPDLDEELHIPEENDSDELSLDLPEEELINDSDEISIDLDENLAALDDTLPETEIEDTEVSNISSEFFLEEEDLTVPEIDEDTELETENFDDIAAVESSFLDDELEIKDENLSEESFEEEPIVQPKQEAENTGDLSVLRSIEDELHAIRSELMDLRSELKRLRSTKDDTSKEADALPEEEPVSEEIPEEENLASPDSNAELETGGGFFEDDEDETIALTGDELDNILNSAEFTEEEGEPSQIDDQEFSPEEPLAEEINISAESEDPNETEESLNAGSFEDEGLLNEFAPIEEIELEEVNASGADSSETQSSEEDEISAIANMDIEKELEGIEDLKDEENNDLDLYTGEDFSDLTIDMPENPDELSDIEMTIGEDQLPEIETPEDTIEAETPVSPLDEAGQEELDEQAETALPDIENAVESESDDLSQTLRHEIKAVLSYMDKLLESLPEEKIEEFARSEHFDVYKKLFDELGI